MDDLGQSIANIAAVISFGTVVFLPSYAFLDAAFKRWTTTGLLDRVSKKRKVFSEPKAAAETEGILKSYSAAASVSQ